MPTFETLLSPSGGPRELYLVQRHLGRGVFADRYVGRHYGTSGLRADATETVIPSLAEGIAWVRSAPADGEGAEGAPLRPASAPGRGVGPAR